MELGPVRERLGSRPRPSRRRPWTSSSTPPGWKRAPRETLLSLRAASTGEQSPTLRSSTIPISDSTRTSLTRSEARW